ncbi:hypothetical protein BGX20_006947, partial [Mortierella sp. AD010]
FQVLSSIQSLLFLTSLSPKSKMLISKVLALALAGCLFVDNTQATNADWSGMTYNQALATGQQTSQLTGQAITNGAGGCAVAVVGMIAAATGAVACAVIPPPGEVACLGSGAMSWFAGLFSSCMTTAIYECDQIGQSFTGNYHDVRCYAAEWVVHHPPPNGVLTDVKNFYK